MSIKETKKTYLVRSFVLHKEIFTQGRKSRQTYQPGDAVELTDTEAKRYQHLIETPVDISKKS